MSRKRDYRGRFVKTKFEWGCSGKVLKLLLAFCAGVGTLGAFTMIAVKGVFVPGVVAFFIWGLIFWWAIGAPKFWQKKSDEQPLDLPTNSTQTPITSDKPISNTMEWVYQRQFERLKPKIDAGLPISLNEYEIKNMKPFFDVHYPNQVINIISPIIIKTTVAGLQYHDAKKKAVKDMFKEPWGEILDLEREPFNPHGATATKILWNNHFLGYVPREYSKEISESIDLGKNVSASVDDYDANESHFNRLKIEIRIDNA